MKNILKKGDFIVFSFVFVLLLASLVLVLSTRTFGSYAVVTVNGDEIGRYSLGQNGVYVLNGGTNTMVIENGCVYLSDADCPNRLCVNQGKIKYDGQSIICLPNKLTISIKGNSQGVDVVL